MENSAKALEQTKALADTLAADKDGKFANSKFLQFVSKMSRGEITLEGNEVSSCPQDMKLPCTCQQESSSDGLAFSCSPQWLALLGHHEPGLQQ